MSMSVRANSARIESAPLPLVPAADQAEVNSSADPESLLQILVHSKAALVRTATLRRTGF